ncbi:MAG: asparagine synthase C-terminal domain-containing protein [Burkholderiales bacterium]
MFRFRGQLEFPDLPARWPSVNPPTATGTVARWAAPGLSLEWAPDHVDVATSPTVIVLVAHRARPPLGAAGPRESAAKVWLARYIANGENVVAGTNEPGAFCVVDLERRRALLWVDRFAIETACYRSSGSTFGFADACGDVPGTCGELDPQAIYDYLYFHIIPAPRTILRDVQRVENAHCVTADAHGVRSSAYWRPHFRVGETRDLARRLREFPEIVKSAVARDADDPRTACFLSGGTDSSTIAGMLARVRGEPVHAYSIGFESEGYDEMAYARIAARHFGLVHREHYVTPDEVATAIPQLAAAFDQPFGNSSVVPAHSCAALARSDGFTTMLAGDGGDELFGGNARYATQKIFAPYARIPAVIRGVIEPPASSWRIFRSVPGLRQLGGYVRHARLPMPDRMTTFNLLERLGAQQVLTAACLGGINPDGPAADQRRTWAAIGAEALVDRMLAYDWKYTLADSDMPKVRWATRLAGIDVAYPLLAHELVDIALALPPECKVKGLRLRWFFKEALRDFLPREIITKSKHGFGLPFGPWCLRHARLRAVAEDSLTGIVERGIVRPEFARELMERRLAEAPGYYGEMVWILMMLEQWLRHHDPARGSAPVA